MCQIKNESLETQWEKIWDEIKNIIPTKNEKTLKNENINDFILNIKNDWINNQKNITEIRKIKTENWIERFELIHGKKFLYHLSFYTNHKSKFKIICTKCGNIFEAFPTNHLKTYGGCKQCKYKILTQEEWIETCVLKFGNKFDYSLVVYINTNIKVKIKCNTCHSMLYILPHNHLRDDGGCMKCAKNKAASLLKFSLEEFIQKAIYVHGNKYSYIYVIYINAKTKVKILCNKCKQIFEQTPSHHLYRKQGCPICNIKGQICEPKLFKKIQKEFSNYKIIKSGKPNWLLNHDGHKKQHLDIYFPDYNIAIEYQGEQHFKPVKYFGGEERFISNQKSDIMKYKLCLENNCKLFYFSYDNSYIPKNYPHKVYIDETELINEIKNYINEKVKNIYIIS